MTLSIFGIGRYDVECGLSGLGNEIKFWFFNSVGNISSFRHGSQVLVNTPGLVLTAIFKVLLEMPYKPGAFFVGVLTIFFAIFLCD